MSPDISNAIASAAGTLRSVAFAADDRAAGVTFDLALTQDLDDLVGAPDAVAGLARLELWRGGSPPQWMTRRWDGLLNALVKLGNGWEVWVNWYADRLAGLLRSDRRELAYVEVPKGLWVDGPAGVNTWIAKRVEELVAQWRSSAEPPESRADGSLGQVSEMPDIEALPQQAMAATQFIANSEGLIDLVPDPPGHMHRADAIQRDHYEEMRHKAIDLTKLGSNQHADLAASADRFLAEVPTSIEVVSIIRLWSPRQHAPPPPEGT
jgi:hypothetical protein